MKKLPGILLIAISAASFGTLAIFGRWAYTAGIDTLTLLFLRFTIAALLMGIVLMVRHENLPRGKVLWQIIGMGAIGYVGQSFSYLSAIKYASAGLVALLLYLYPMMVAVLSVIIFKEKLTGIKVMAMAIALAGTALTVSPNGGGQWQGIALALAAAVVYSVYIIVGTHVMKQVSAVQSSTIIFASSGAVYFVLMMFNGPQFPTTPSGWAVVFGTVIFATIIPVVTFLAGLKYIGPTNASMLSTLEPVVTVVLAAILFGEKLGFVTLFGGGLILLAVILLARAELKSVNESRG